MFTIPGRIPITISPFFLLVAASIGWFSTQDLTLLPIWIGVIFVSILAHELGHALTAVYFGQKARIDLVILGGITLRTGGKISSWKEFLIVLNGPLAGLSLWALSESILGIYSDPHSLWSYGFYVASRVNLFWTIVNLLPVQPLDGGRLLALLLEGIFGLRGVKIALFVSLLLSGLAALVFFTAHQFFAGSLFLLFMCESWRDWKNTASLAPIDTDLIVQGMLKDAEKMIHERRHDLAVDKLNQIRRITDKGVIYTTATQYLAELISMEGNFKEAFDLLIPLEKKIAPESLCLLQRLAYKAGEYREAVRVGGSCYQTMPSYEVAVVNALASSLLGEAKQAVGWLQCAVREGVPNLSDLLNKKEFDPIRKDSRFQDIYSRLVSLK